MKKEVMNTVPEEKITKINVGSLIFFSILGILILILLFGTIYTIEAGERGILLTFGKPDLDAKGEGIHMKIPIAQKIVKMDVKTQNYQTEASAATKDLQVVPVTIAVNFHPVEESIPELYRTVGLSYAEKIIHPTIQDTVKGITTQFRADEFGENRQVISTQIRDELKNKLLTKGIIVDDAYLVNYDFSPQYNAAIEAKQTAEQNALAEKNRLEQIQYQADQRVAQAEGEAKAIRAQAEAIKAQGGAEYVQLQWIAKWDGKLPQYSFGGQGAVPFINIQQSTQTP